MSQTGGVLREMWFHTRVQNLTSELRVWGVGRRISQARAYLVGLRKYG